MFEALTSKLDYFKPLKVVPAFMEALKQAKETKDKGFFERVSLFFEAFKAEMDGVKKEKEEVKKDAEGSADKPLEEMLGGAKKETGVDQMEEGEDKQNAEAVVAAAVASLKEVGGAAGAGAEAVKKGEELSAEQAKALGGAGFSTLLKLKKQFGESEEKFIKAMSGFEKAGDKSAFSLNNLLKLKTLKLFKLSGTEAMKLADKFDIGMTDLLEVKGLSVLKEKKLDGKELSDVTETVGKFFMPNTDKKNLEKVVTMLNKVLVEKPEKLSKEELAVFVCNVAEADFEKFVKALS